LCVATSGCKKKKHEHGQSEEGLMAALDVDSYLNERVQDQIDYHDRKAVESHRRFRRLALLSIGATSLTPLLLALSMTFSPPSLDEPLNVVFGILPIVVAVVAAVATASLSAFKHKESWITHRTVCEALRREAHLFRFNAGPYAQATDPPALFVERAEGLMESEGKEWKQLYADATETPRGNPQV
jgi:Protein of unknown function (DUF4231)